MTDIFGIILKHFCVADNASTNLQADQAFSLRLASLSMSFCLRWPNLFPRCKLSELCPLSSRGPLKYFTISNSESISNLAVVLEWGPFLQVRISFESLVISLLREKSEVLTEKSLQFGDCHPVVSAIFPSRNLKALLKP